MLRNLLYKQKLHLLPNPIIGDSFNGYLLRCMLAAWLIAKVISFKLWIAYRLFPIVSPFNFPFTFPLWVHTFLFASSVITMFILFLFPQKRVIIYLLLGMELLSCLLDQMRWQPWEYQFIITLIVFIINKSKPERIVYMMQLILAATYFYSGLQKLNPAFLPVFWQGMILKSLLQVKPEVLNLPAILFTGNSIPWFEAIGGVLLLFNSTSKLGAKLMIAMHVLILLIIGPQALNYNKVVWSWNVFMVTYLYLIFLHNKEDKRPLSLFYSPSFNLPIIVLCAVIPILNFVNLWPNFFSFSLYSCKSKEMIICINDDKTTTNELSQFFEKNDSRFEGNEMNIIKVNSWALNELSITPYPEESAYIKLSKKFLKNYPNSGARFYVYNLPYDVKRLKELK